MVKPGADAPGDAGGPGRERSAPSGTALAPGPFGQLWSRLSGRSPLDDSELHHFRETLGGVRWIGTTLGLSFLAGALLLHGHVPTPWLLAAGALFVLEWAAREALAARYLALPVAAQRDGRWRTLVWGTGILSGTLYGLSSLVLMLPLPTPTLLGLAAAFGAIITVFCRIGSQYMPSTWMMVAPLFVPLPIALLASDRVGGWLATLPILWLGYLALALTRANARGTAALERARQEAERNRAASDRAVVDKNRFIARASHDLRQPLHALNLWHGALRTRLRGSEAEPLLESSAQSIDAVNRLLDSLMDISRLDAGEIRPERHDVDVGELLDGLEREFRPLAGSRGIAFDVGDSDALVHTDPVLLARVLRNLIANALAHSRGGRVAVDVRGAPPRTPGEGAGGGEGGPVVLDVVDTGDGIADEELERVFEEFYRVERTGEGTATPGFGLGLSIVRRLCRLLDIDVRLRSTLGAGTTFTLALPGGRGSSPLLEDEEEELLDIAGRRVLVLDDDARVLASTCAALRDWDCRTLAATTLADAERRLQDEPAARPDLLLCDHHLGAGRTGLEAIRALRARLGDDALPALIVSGDSSPELPEVLEAARVRLLHKPLTPLELRVALGRELDERERSSPTGERAVPGMR